MLNITKALKDSVSIAFQKAFARHHDIQILFQNLKYSTSCPATFSEYYKSNYQKEWKETLLPKDVAHEILVHFQSPTWNQFKLVSNIEVTQLGDLQFQINKQYYEHLIKQIDSTPWPNLTPIYKTTNIYGPFINLNGPLNKTDLRGLHIQNRLYCILSKLSENCNKFNKITNQISKNDYLILPAKIVCQSIQFISLGIQLSLE
ncbi:unnamed protein product (macronuclear) [Paramecium tetraurelia]|uniref:Uncharacterized protein n=1 Tax=Paramecium tetraurelia TaxID=5888 RepID=A0BJF5_PARTE|nr:uncharacterized protein GSPATT00029299001 [Paramecium tetraurelia]CAK58672.1 unnamed protein product [Paramecium tetraurelia]|eukprot:XP_001426070.1 hypothetical protein (macronuclear) [Paramecium tetraurelia strain d4-2]